MPHTKKMNMKTPQSQLSAHTVHTLDSEERSSSMKSARESAYTILNEDELADGFNAHLVVPDILDRPPPDKLPVFYGDNSSIDMGNLLTAEDLRYKPIVDLERTDAKKFYTLIMTDPDVPNRAMPSDREHLHWLVVNVTDQRLERGEEIVPYKAPLPNLGSGLHRYVFVLLEQSRPITIATEAEKAAMMLKAVAAASNGAKKTAEMDLKQQQQQQARSPSASKTAAGTAAGSSGGARPHTSVKLKEPKTPDTPIQLIECVKFSTRDFCRKYAVLGVVAASFFQTEYNEYVGKQLEAQRKGLDEDKREEVKKVMKLDEKKTIDSMHRMKISK